MEKHLRYLYKQYFFINIILIMLVITTLQGQTNDTSGTFTYIKNTIVDDAKHMFNLGLNVIQAPLNFDGRDYAKIGITSAITSAMFLTDRDIKRFALKNQTKTNDRIFKIDDYFNGTSGFFGSAGIYLIGFITKDEKIRRIGLKAAEALFIAQSVTGTLKYTFGRRRPYGGRDQMDFKIFRGSAGRYRALPSGHTTSAFTFATVMAKSIDNMPWKIFWYGSATMVGFARIYHNVHWFSDTFLAAMLSYSIASYVVDFDSEQTDMTKHVTFSFNPVQNLLGVKLTF